MNKKEIKNMITRTVCQFVSDLGYSVDDDGFHGSLTFTKHGSSIDDSIEWNRSYREAVCVNWASDEVKADCEAINEYMKSVIIYWEAQYTPKRAMAQFGSYIHVTQLIDMKQKKVKAYHIEHDGCYSNIVVINTHKENVDNYHTTFFKLADAKRELLSSLKLHIDEYTYAAKRIRAINNETVPQRSEAE